MATITSTRLTKKQSLQTEDAWCVRVERQDGAIIRFCDYDLDLTMSTRIDKNGNSTALSTDVTYYSASGYTPTAISEAQQFKPGTVDLEGVLDAVTTASGTTTTEFEYTVSTVSATESNGSNAASNAVDGDNTTAWETSATIDPVDTWDGDFDSIYIQLGFDEEVEINKLRFDRSVAATEYEYWAVDVSFDGVTYQRIIPMMNHSTNDGSFDIDFPNPTKLRRLRLYPGPSVSTGSATTRTLYDVRPILSKTGSNLGSVAKNDIAAGLYDYARVFVFVTDAANPVEDEEKMFSGFWGQASLVDGKYITEFRGLLDVLNQSSGRFFNSQCDAVFGGQRCGVPLDVKEWSSEMFVTTVAETGDRRVGIVVKPTSENGYFYKATAISNNNKTGSVEPTWPTIAGATIADGDITWTAFTATTYNTTVTSVTSRTKFTSSAAAAIYTDNSFKNGYVEFTSGDLSGLRFYVKSYDGLGGITLRTQTPVDISPGDGIKLVKGCQKRFITDCKNAYDNFTNFQGFPYIPGNQNVRVFGGQR